MGEYSVFCCKKTPRPLRRGIGELEDRTWRSWTEGDESAGDKQLGPVVRYFEEAGG